MTRKQSSKVSVERVRLDQWLWAARFFKTRSLAKQAIENGKIHIDQQKAKPSRELCIGMVLRIRQGWDEKTVVVTGLSARRGSAPMAASLYQETPESVLSRERKVHERKASGISGMILDGKPDKKKRRQIHRFLRQHNEEHL